MAAIARELLNQLVSPNDEEKRGKSLVQPNSKAATSQKRGAIDTPTADASRQSTILAPAVAEPVADVDTGISDIANTEGTRGFLKGTPEQEKARRKRKREQATVTPGPAGPGSGEPIQRVDGKRFIGVNNITQALNELENKRKSAAINRTTNKSRQRSRAVGARGRRDTILTSSLGITGDISGRRKTLLGR